MEYFSAQFSRSFEKLTEKLSDWVDVVVLQLPNLVIALLIIFIAIFSAKFIRKLSVKTTSKITSNKTVLNLVSNLTAVLFSIFILFIILGIFNLGSTINKILATAGVLGLAIGLALQDPMNNLFSGVFMSVRELYKIGDLVETNGYFGTIFDIDLRATKLRMPSGQQVVIPNKDVIQNPLTNFTVSGVRRVDLVCGISYGDKLRNVEKVVREAISNLDKIDKNKEIDFFFTDFGGSSVNFKTRFWINAIDQKSFLTQQSKGIIAIKESLDANGISIPYPITTLDFGIKGGVSLDAMLTKSDSHNKNEKLVEPIS